MSGEDKVVCPHGYVWDAKGHTCSFRLGLPRELREASLRVSNARLAVERAVEEYGHAIAELTLLQRKWGGVL